MISPGSDELKVHSHSFEIHRFLSKCDSRVQNEILQTLNLGIISSHDLDAPVPFRVASPCAARCQFVVRAERNDVVEPPIPNPCGERLSIVMEKRKKHRYL